MSVVRPPAFVYFCCRQWSVICTDGCLNVPVCVFLTLLTSSTSIDQLPGCEPQIPLILYSGLGNQINESINRNCWFLPVELNITLKYITDCTGHSCRSSEPIRRFLKLKKKKVIDSSSYFFTLPNPSPPNTARQCFATIDHRTDRVSPGPSCLPFSLETRRDETSVFPGLLSPPESVCQVRLTLN